MISYYYALWIPQYKEGIPAIANRHLAEEDLRDRATDPRLLVSGEIDKATGLISLSYQLGDSPCRFLLFHKISAIETGFIVFKLNLNDDETDFLCNDLRKSMPKAIYHCIKHFFHIHEFHSSDDDSLLEAYFSETPIDLNNEETLREIIKVYLQSYIQKYAGYVDLCRNTLNEVSYNKSLDIKYDKSKQLLEEIVSNNQKILDGESKYCDFLINSYPNLIQPDFLQRIFGLRNELARYNERLEQQKERLVSSFSIKLGKIGLVASVVGSAVGVLVSFALSKCSSNELQDSVSTIKSEIHQMNEEDVFIKQKLEIIKQQEDSILKILHRN